MARLASTHEPVIEPNLLTPPTGFKEQHDAEPIRIAFIAILKIVLLYWQPAMEIQQVLTVQAIVRSWFRPRPLTVHSSNPRYFQDPDGNTLYLTGAHTWQNLQDRGRSDPPPAFNYTNYLDLLENHNHNFIRMWRWEFPKFRYKSSSAFQYSKPHPWARAGRETALDGKPKFDLTKFNQAYFDRLRTRIITAKDRGIYVSIMLFEGHALQFASEAWFSHPFNVENNVNGIDGDLNKDGRGLELHTLDVPYVTAIQEAYVRKVIDTVNDLDNVLYEIASESHGSSDAWQEHMIDYIHSYEANKPRQHPVIYSAAWGYDGSQLWASRAEAVSPGWDGKDWAISPYRDDPPSNDGRKVIINDTDHLWGEGGNQGWVWKSFVRGLNPIFMDSYNDSVYPNITNMPVWTRLKTALTIWLRYLFPRRTRPGG
jgi:hypothetical protein